MSLWNTFLSWYGELFLSGTGGSPRDNHRTRRFLHHRTKQKLRYYRIRTDLYLSIWLLFLPFTLSEGLFIHWAVNPVATFEKDTASRRPSDRRPITGRQHLFNSQQRVRQTALKDYANWSTSSKGWESIAPPWPSALYPVYLDSHVLSSAFSEFSFDHDTWGLVTLNEMGDKRLDLLPDRTVPSSLFTLQSSKFDQSPRSFLPNGLPDLSDILGKSAPQDQVLLEPKCYQVRYPLSHRNQSLTGDIHDNTFSIVFDTGCSMASTFDIDDFESPPVQGEFGKMKLVQGTVDIKACGIVRWIIQLPGGTTGYIRAPAYLVPGSDQRLFSPQHYSGYHGWGNSSKDSYGGNDKFVWIYLNKEDAASGEAQGIDTARVAISTFDGIPYLRGEPKASPTIPCKQDATSNCECVKCHYSKAFHLGVLAGRNTNLSPAQKTLLLDHQRLGHVHIAHLRELYKPRVKSSASPSLDEAEPCDSCLPMKYGGVMECSVPMCLACQLAKAKQKSTGALHSTKNKEREHVLTQNILKPGEMVFVDHYESSVRGRLPNTKGRETPGRMYCGGTIMVDCASSLIMASHQVSLGATDTLRSKQIFEAEAAQCGIQIERYHADNGHFTAKEFTAKLQEQHQPLSLSGVGAQHQNALAERAIQTVHNSARAMMLHMNVHWPNEYDAKLWPFALDYAIWLYNHLPQRESGLAPIELFCGTTVNCDYLRRARVFGCPSYVLDPKLQDGKKIPKWKPRARMGQFLGFSKLHSSSVGLIRNLLTGHISPQFHVVYDQTFDTVVGGLQERAPIELTEDTFHLFLRSKWDTEARVNALADWETSVDGELPNFPPGWDDGTSLDGNLLPPDVDHRITRGEVVSAPIQPDTVRRQLNFDDEQPGVVPPSQSPFGGGNGHSELSVGSFSPPLTRAVTFTEDDTILETGSQVEDDDLDDGQPPATAPTSPTIPATGEPTVEADTAGPILRRSTRTRVANRTIYNDSFQANHAAIRNTWMSKPTCYSSRTRVAMEVNWNTPSRNPIAQHFEQFSAHYTCPINGDVFQAHPMGLHARLQGNEEDEPTYKDVLRLSAEEQVKWFDSMDVELRALDEMRCFEVVDQSVAIGREIVPCTWALKRKRRPDGSLLKYKSRLVMRGDKMTEGLQEGELAKECSGYAPVVDWGTLRMLLALSVQHKLHTTHVDFCNAFVQAPLERPMFMQLPQGVRDSVGYIGKILQLNRSLYGHRFAAKLFYELLASRLGQIGFTASQHDHCLFLRSDCVIVTWVDDAIIIARDPSVADAVIEEIRGTGFALDKEEANGGLAAYLGIQIDRREDGSLHMTQAGLIDSILEALDLGSANAKHTPAVDALGKCKDSPTLLASYNYRSVVGMMMYLSNSTRPDIAFAVHQCARFSHDPRTPHGTALKRIGTYLLSTRDKGLIMQPCGTEQQTLNCYVDADFAGLFGREDPNDPSCARSRTGYIITLGENPVIWNSKLQTEIALSTQMSEYIALSSAMRSLVHLRRVHIELMVTLGLPFDPDKDISTVYEDNAACIALANFDPPRLTPQSRTMAVKYHWFRAQLSPKTIVVTKVDTALNRSNILTKALT